MPRHMFFLCFMLASLMLAPSASAMPKSPAELARFNSKLMQTSVTYGSIPSLYRPLYGRVLDADLSMDKEDPVFIVIFPTGPRIYPQRIMVWHMVVNELIDDLAYAVTYCPITGTLAAYDAHMNGANLLFDAEGRLYDGNAVLIDRNTGSLWLQILGMAFEGPLTGRGMPLLPVFWTTWQYARSFYADAPVLLPPQGSRRAYARDPYGSYAKKGTYYDNDILIYPVSRLDRRLPRKTPMLGLEYQGTFLGVDIGYVKKKGVVNFFLGETPMVAVHDRKLNVIRVFNRQIWEKPSLFIIQNSRLTDIATRSLWDISTGKAVEGNMMGASMTQYYGIYSMWFSWYDINPETYVIPGPGEVPADVLNVTPLDK